LRLLDVLRQKRTQEFKKSADADTPIRRFASPGVLLFGLLFVTIFGLVQPSRIVAQTAATWNLPNATGSWLTPGNWSPAVVPNGTGYVVGIGSNGTATLTGSNSLTVEELFVGQSSASGTVTLDGGGTSTPTLSATAIVWVGSGGTGSLNILNGAVLNSVGALEVGNPGVIGFVNVSGGTINMTGSGALEIGVDDVNPVSASMIVQNGGSINFATTNAGPGGIALYLGGHSPGSLTITGTGSNVTVWHDITIGRGYGTGIGDGTLSLLNGGTMTVNGGTSTKIFLGGSTEEGSHNGIGIINFGSTTGTIGAPGPSGNLITTSNIYLEGTGQINFNNTDTATLGANILQDTGGINASLVDGRYRDRDPDRQQHLLGHDYRQRRNIAAR